ncbi:somatostatin 6 [Engraulis encrasicolus]|uniref:somatostatin 6 n=1 Tax=Engraulis encrasicolus TaxID=184585 RepID=UPI002FCF3A50
MGFLVRLDSSFSVSESAWITMRLLATLAPLILIVWSGGQTGALPIPEELQSNKSLAGAEERMLLMKMLAGMSERNLTDENLTSSLGLDEEHLNGTVKGSPAPTPPESTCKNFFWKTISSC